MNKKVQSLSLKNFAAFEAVDLDFCPGLNVLIGTNSTGKTLTIKVIYALLKAHQNYCRKDQLPHEQGLDKIFRFPEIFQIEDLKELIHCHKTSMKAHLEFAGTYIGFGVEDRKPATHYHPEFGNRFIYLTPSPVYIPSQEILSIHQGFTALYEKRELPYDETYYDLSIALSLPPFRKENLGDVQEIIDFLRRILTGENHQQEQDIITQSDNRFYFELPEGLLETHLVAEGYRKIATLLLLLKNGELTQNSVLLWDEPEANLNPKLIVLIVEVLKKLVSAGMQIFITTHDYLLAHELSLLAEYQTNADIDMRFFALYKSDRTTGVNVEPGQTLAEIEHNPILEEFAAHYDRESVLFENGGQEEVD